MIWKEKMPAPVRDMKFAEYATAREERPVAVDCALGTNPLGSPGYVNEILGSGRLPDPSGYPGDDLPFRRALSDSWGRIFSPEDVVIGTGSIGLIITLARTFCTEGCAVLGVTPQFPDGPMHFQLAGASYRSVDLLPPDFTLRTKLIVEAMTGEESIVYIDRPHNPTGQVPPLEDMAVLAKECENRGALMIVDEAYGDFIPDEESALNLDQQCVIVLRSFSKGRGLAGIRAGYCVIHNGEALNYVRKVAPPFAVSSMALELGAASLLDREYILRSRETVSEVKGRVLQIISDTPGVTAAKTDPGIPILLVSMDEDGADLYERLMEQGIRTEAGECFEGLGGGSARLRVPGPEQVEVFERLWKRAFKTL